MRKSDGISSPMGNSLTIFDMGLLELALSQISHMNYQNEGIISYSSTSASIKVRVL